MKEKVTMQDIAERLNLSKNSVSQALSGKAGVSEETRKLILEIASQMGYVYSSTNRKSYSPSPKKGTIALIASDFAFSMKSFFGEIYLIVEQEAAARGMNLQIQSISQGTAEQLLIPAIMQNQSIDGVLILSHITTDYINSIIATGKPTVLIDHHHPYIHADSILTNNRFSAFEAVRYLAELGHRKIGILTDISFSPSYYERLEGFLLAMNEFGIPIREEWILRDAKENASYILSAIESLEEQPSAWFCVNDGLSFLLCSTLQKLGVQIPGQVSIVSFDNGYLSQMSIPTITTMDVNLKLYAQKAVEQLIWRMDHPNEPFTELLLPTKLLIRQSTGPAPY
ncbi:LacI family DNA-binding transcriptional regulator [Paenibacillus donghaensis]|uniref:LacI family transcriptional regulator n=1 Tax=Paenibacillus donghaensis TaxID=414771 RepID=A0A2Z2KIP0_9BACL|nr:LacI family DNA-binding transcriptional regulator [Paenibacillus donghaensis]ASA26084.1 LacI family transcriptional regulator [Paenibacillus donghaensis]